ncbi:MAG: DUF262 domain-containing protein [Bacteroidetes bacterium]|nr:DUF262 domain-containing protein [Bacteroidota bacterium]
MNENMITNLLSIKEITENKLFKVPDYQRGYSWEESQLSDLTKDIEHISSKNHRHYTGTIVIANSNGNERFDIVDGQQRLTTLIILLKLIYDLNPVKYASIESDFLIRDDDTFVMELNLETNRYFKEAIISEKQSIPANIKSLQNLKYAKEYLQNWLKDHNDSIDTIFTTITEKLGFICFSPENTNEIGIMFEVINNRGKALSELEKIKNYFIYYSTINAKDSLRSKINDNWGEILRNLSEAGATSNDEENNFLRNCFIVFYSPNKSKSWYVYDELKLKYKPEDNTDIDEKITEIKQFIDFLNEAARHFAYFYGQKVFERDYKGALKTELSAVLKRLRCHPVNASIFPLYLATMSFLYVRPQDVLDMLKLLEILNFRVYVIPNTKIARADSKQGDLFFWAHDFYHDRDWHSDNDEEEFFTWKERPIVGDVFSFISMNLEDFIQILCPEVVFIQSLTIDNDEAVDYFNWNGLRFFLASYEEYLNSKRKMSWDIEQILLTRNEVKKELGNDYLSKEHIWARKNRETDFPVDTKEKRRLGNFALLGMLSNIQLQNDDIDQKVQFLIDNSSITMIQVDQLKKYLENAILVADSRRQRKTKYYYLDLAISLVDQRENDLIKFALERWKLPNERFGKFLKIDAFQAYQEGKNENFYLKEKNNPR